MLVKLNWYGDTPQTLMWWMERAGIQNLKDVDISKFQRSKDEHFLFTHQRDNGLFIWCANGSQKVIKTFYV